MGGGNQLGRESAGEGTHPTADYARARNVLLIGVVHDLLQVGDVAVHEHACAGRV